jgi:hypothetical protein
LPSLMLSHCLYRPANLVCFILLLNSKYIRTLMIDEQVVVLGVESLI